MLYLFSGDDAKSKVKAYESFVKSVAKGVEIIKFNRNNFDRAQIESLYSGAGLFFAKSFIIFSDIFEYEETRDFILDRLESMAQSSNDFIFLDSKLTKDILDEFRKIEPKKIQINVFELPKEKKERFDNFLVANAFANRDKLNTWIYFRQAVDRGVVMEELSGVISWKIKDMLLKKSFGKFKEQELKNYIMKLSYLLPEARIAQLDAESAFEAFLLEAF